MNLLYIFILLSFINISFSEESSSIKNIIESNKTGMSISKSTSKNFVRSFYPNGKVKEQKRDINNDGKIDQIVHYKESGTILSKFDLNFDGVFEKEFLQFVTGKNITFEKITMDLNADKRIDYILTRTYFSKENSYFERVKIDANFDGKFESDKLTKWPIQTWTHK